MTDSVAWLSSLPPQDLASSTGRVEMGHSCLPPFVGEIFELKAELNSDKKEKKKEAVKKVIASMTVGKDVRCAGVTEGGFLALSEFRFPP